MVIADLILISARRTTERVRDIGNLKAIVPCARQIRCLGMLRCHDGLHGLWVKHSIQALYNAIPSISNHSRKASDRLGDDAREAFSTSFGETKCTLLPRTFVRLVEETSNTIVQAVCEGLSNMSATSP